MVTLNWVYCLKQVISPSDLRNTRWHLLQGEVDEYSMQSTCISGCACPRNRYHGTSFLVSWYHLWVWSGLFKKLFYLFEKLTEREKEMFQMLFHFTSSCNHWDWARLKLGDRIYILLFGTRARTPSPWAFLHCLPGNRQTPTWSDMRCWHHRRWWNPLPHNAGYIAGLLSRRCLVWPR